jgi:hypothetical protein
MQMTLTLLLMCKLFWVQTAWRLSPFLTWLPTRHFEILKFLNVALNFVIFIFVNLPLKHGDLRAGFKSLLTERKHTPFCNMATSVVILNFKFVTKLNKGSFYLRASFQILRV